jgi:hypothetical protein
VPEHAGGACVDRIFTLGPADAAAKHRQDMGLTFCIRTLYLARSTRERAAILALQTDLVACRAAAPQCHGTA